jgi:hypothetical protein
MKPDGNHDHTTPSLDGANVCWYRHCHRSMERQTGNHFHHLTGDHLLDRRRARIRVSGSLGTGIPLMLKCSTCKLSRRNIFGGALTGELWRTGKTRPYKGGGRYSRQVSRVTKTAHQLWCSVCGEYMWSAHNQAANKPLAVEVDLDGNVIK